MNEKQPIEVSFDLETMGNTPDAMVVSVGACMFDLSTGDEIDTFEMRIDWEPSIRAGRQIDAETLRWWMLQCDEARQAITSKVGAVHHNVMLAGLTAWLDRPGKRISPWGNGSLFDVGILENLYRQNFLNVPWSFRDVNDLRTLLRVAKACGFDIAAVQSVGVKHRALDDARYQARLIHAAWKYLKELHALVALQQGCPPVEKKED